jgi:hypothetical protein
MAVLQMGAADPRAGTWTLISAQSSLDPPNKLSITTVDKQSHVVMTGETRIDFTAKVDGHDTAVPNNPAFDQVELRRIGKSQVVVTEKKAGALVATIHDKLSSDGNELTTATVSQGHPDQTTVWTRSGAKHPNDPFAGEWTEDMSKSRMRQGLVLKIVGDGSGGVRFSGDFSYDAHFDGKPYDLKNSRNDTVQLAMVDAHTVDAVYRRDNQVTQKDRYVVSADGRTMTVTSTGAYETGQHFTEKLVFQKQ